MMQIVKCVALMQIVRNCVTLHSHTTCCWSFSTSVKPVRLIRMTIRMGFENICQTTFESPDLNRMYSTCNRSVFFNYQLFCMRYPRMVSVKSIASHKIPHTLFSANSPSLPSLTKLLVIRTTPAFLEKKDRKKKLYIILL